MLREGNRSQKTAIDGPYSVGAASSREYSAEGNAEVIHYDSVGSMKLQFSFCAATFNFLSETTKLSMKSF